MEWVGGASRGHRRTAAKTNNGPGGKGISSDAVGLPISCGHVHANFTGLTSLGPF